MIEVQEQIAAVERGVGRRTGPDGAVHVLRLRLVLATPAEDLWDAVTDADRLPRWFLPVDGELRPGARYRLEGNAEGTIEACEPGASFAATWEFGGTVGRILVRVEPAGADRARLVLEHETAADDETWAAYGPGATGVGWDLSLLGLVLHVDSRGAFDPEHGTTWAGEDDGGRFVALSGEAWHDADVAAGTDPRRAREAADRTIEAYLATDEG